MAARIRHHIRSNVVGYMALFVALSGTAYAIDGPLPGQNQVGSADIINNEVQTADIKDANLTTADIRSGAVTSGKVLDDTAEGGGLSAADLAPVSVGPSELQTNAIPANGFGDDGSTKLGDNSVNFNELAPDSIEGSKVEDESLTGADVDEPSLGTVPAADKVDGADVCSAAVQTTTDSFQSVLCTMGPFTVKAQCIAFGGTQSLILIETSQDDAYVASNYGSDPDYDAGDGVLQLTAASDSTDDGAGALSPVDSFYAGSTATGHIAGTVGARANRTGSSTGTCEALVSAVG